MMTWWKTIIAVSTFCACVANAGAFHHTEQMRKLAANDKLKSTDDLCLTPECIHAASWILTNSNFSADPCDDFYTFACGNAKLVNIPDKQWLRKEALMAYDELMVRLRSLIEDIDKTKVPKHFGLLRTLYDNCMNAAEERYLEAISYYKRIMAESNSTDGWPVLLGNRWNGSKSHNKSKVLTYLLSIEWTADSEDSLDNVPNMIYPPMEVMRMGFNNEFVQAYYEYMIDIAVLLGATRAQAEVELKEALLLGIDVARSLDPEVKDWFHRRPRIKTTVKEFVEKYPSLKDFILSHIKPSSNLSDSNVMLVECDFGEFEKVLSSASDRVVANWIYWEYLQGSVQSFDPGFKARMHPNRNFPLQEREEPTWQKCVSVVRSELGHSLSALYQRKYMSQNIVNDFAGMVTNIKQQMHRLLAEADWPDTEARRVIGHKIDDLIAQVSYRDEYVDDKELERLYEKVELVEGTMASSLNNISDGLSSATPHPSRSPDAWNNWLEMGNILTLDLIYESSENYLKIDAPITLKNFYHIDRPKYLNYGTFGSGLAHEMGHLMSLTSVDGDLTEREWLSSESERKFDERMRCIVDKFGTYTVERLGVRLNGYRLAMETAADNIGYKAAYGAYLNWAGENTVEKMLPGIPYTTKQMFWISLASSMCEKIDKLTLWYTALYGFHAPNKQRINGGVADRPEFADDFKCKPGTKMNPVKKCSVF